MFTACGRYVTNGMPWKWRMLILGCLGLVVVLLVMKIIKSMKQNLARFKRKGSIDEDADNDDAKNTQLSRYYRRRNNNNNNSHNRRHDPSTIFVAVTSTVENVNESINLISKLLDQARIPSRISVGLLVMRCPIHHRVVGGQKVLETITKEKFPTTHSGRIKIYLEPTSEWRGPSCSLNLAINRLYGGQKYLAMMSQPRGQVHRHWDVLVIQDFTRACAEVSSLEPAAAETADKFGARNSDDDDDEKEKQNMSPLRSSRSQNLPVLLTCQNSNHKGLPTFTQVEGWTEWGFPLRSQRIYKRQPIRPIFTSVLTFDFVFGLAQGWFSCKCHDDIELVEEDIVEWVRSRCLWNQGWNFFQTTFPILSMDESVFYSRPTFKAQDAVVLRNHPYEGKRWEALMKLWKDLGVLKPMTATDTEQQQGAGEGESYEEMSGIDWKTRTIQAHARVGMCRSPSGSEEHPFDTDEVVAKYGSWTEFWSDTDYREEDTISFKDDNNNNNIHSG